MQNELHSRIIKKILFIFIIITYILLWSFPAHAESSTPDVYSPSCILMELNTGKILYSKNANERMYPASTTKVMTAILTLENCKLTDVATVSKNAIYSVPYSYATAYLQEGEQLTIANLLNVLLIPSANDAAFVLAEHVAGSVDEFSNMMNEKAFEIGCKDTHFSNPNGIHAEDHYSTAYDLALIGKYAMQFQEFRDIVSKTKCSLPTTNKYDKEDRMFVSTNELIKSSSKYYYEYATGAKTGYTVPAGHCIIATSKKEDTELIAVVLNDSITDEGINTRCVDCKTLFEYGFNNFSYKQLASTGDVQKNITISNATKDTRNLNLLPEQDIFAFVPNDYDLSNVVTNITLNEDLKPPITEKEVLGSITYIVDGTSYTTNLLASHSVIEFNFLKTVLELLLVIVVLILVSLFYKKKNKKKHNRKNNSKKKKHQNSNKSQYVDLHFYPKYK